jgi:hypothetical protein
LPKKYLESPRGNEKNVESIMFEIRKKREKMFEFFDLKYNNDIETFKHDHV